MPMACLTVTAQQKCEGVKPDFTPKKNDFTLALTVGYNSYASVQALPISQNYEGAALSTDWSQKQLMVGFEAGWFFNDLWKLNLGGGLNFTNNPGYSAVPGTVDEDSELGDGSIPNYRAVADAYTFGYNVVAGVDRYFKVPRVANLMWYGGARIGAAYALNEQKFDEPEAMGKSTAQSWNLRGSLTVGVDYYILPAFYVGAQIDPLAYTYNKTSYKPEEGLSALDANSHNLGFLAAPTVKVGFKFGKSNKVCAARAQQSCATQDECLKQINELRELIRKQSDRVIYKTDTVYVNTPAQVAAASRPAMKSFVAFGNGQTSVSGTQQMGILAAADYMKLYPETKILVIGYASLNTGSRDLNMRLAKKRAEAVAAILTDKYGIDRSRLEVRAMNDNEQPFQTSDWNRVAILTAQ